MTDGYVADPAALEHDAKQFEAWSAKLTAMAAAAPVGLSPLNFSVIPGAQDVAAHFQKAVLNLQRFLEDGAKNFDGFARTLVASELAYAEAEHASAAEVAALTAELAAL